MKTVMKNRQSQNLAFTDSSMAKPKFSGLANIPFHFALITLLGIGFFANCSQAAVIAGWNVSSLPGGSGNFGPSPLAATTSDPNVTVGGLTRGAGVVTTGTAAARAWGGVDWQSADASTAVAANKYATFTVEANSGYTLSLSSISTFAYRRSGTGASTGTVQYQIGAGSFTDITTVSYTVTAGTGGTLPPIDLTGIGALQNIPAGTVVTFRIVNYGATSAGGTWYIFDTAVSAAHDFEIQGTADVPGAPPLVTDITPPSATVDAGGTASFTVTSTGGAPDYYWYKLTTTTNLIPSATTPTLTLTNVLAADAANYQVVLSNAFGVSTSAVVTLTVNDPIFIWQPVAQVNLAGSTSGFTVNASGTAPLSYQWYRGAPSPGANTLLTDAGRISGTQTRALYISATEAGDAADYFVIVSNGSGAITSAPVSLTVTASGTLVTWDFNAIGLNPTNVEPSQGQANARATIVVATNAFQSTGGTANDPYNSILGVTNYQWVTAAYPIQATGNKSAGAKFAVSTVGFKNLTVTYDHRASATGSKYTRLQYTVNGTDFIDYPSSSSFLSAGPWESRSFSLTGFPGVVNNPNFAIRIASEFESTATYGVVNNPNYIGTTTPTSAGYNSNGTLSYDVVKINAEPIIGGNTPPTISAIANQSTPIITPIQVNFTVGDAQTAVGALIVTASSYNEALVASGSITPGGTGASRNITITPSGVEGVCPILVSVTDADGDVASTWFNLTLTPVNATPTITQIPNTNTLANTPISIPFVIGDDSPVGGLTLVSNSLNTTLIPLANIAITGSGANRTLVLTPVAANAGVAPISISVSDGVNTATTSFALTVRPTTNVVFNDYFDYADGIITNVTGSFWTAHNEGAAGPLSIANDRVTIDGNLSQDCNAPLVGGPYLTNSSAVLYSSFKVNFSVLPSAAGAYFAHFKDNSTFGFYARVWAATNGAATGKFRLGIGNSSNASATSGQFPEDLDTGVDYTVVTRLVLSNGFSTIWINPTSEADTQVTDTTPVTNGNDVYQYGLRQSTGEGTLALDDLIVGTSFADVVPVLTVKQFDTATVVSWANPLLPLQASSLVTGTYTNIPGATSPYTNALPEPQKFFRLFKP